MGVHTTQFEIHDPAVGLYEPVLSLAAETMNDCESEAGSELIKVAGIVGYTKTGGRRSGVRSRIRISHRDW